MFVVTEESEKNSKEKFEALQEKLDLLQEQVHVSDSVRNELGEKTTQMQVDSRLTALVV